MNSLHPFYFWLLLLIAFLVYRARNTNSLDFLSLKNPPAFFTRRWVPARRYEPTLRFLQEKITYETFVRLKWILFLTGWAYVTFLLLLSIGRATFLDDLPWALGLFIIAFFIPDLWLRVQHARALRSLRKDVPYFVDMLAITLEAGMNLDQALLHVASHMQGLLAHQLREELAFYRYGYSLEKILENLITKIPVDEFKRFIASIHQAKRLGVSLGQTLQIQAELLQRIKLQKAEQLSRTAGVKISIPLVLFIFPALLIIYLGPAILEIIQ